MKPYGDCKARTGERAGTAARPIALLVLSLCVAGLAGCRDHAKVPQARAEGPHPVLPAPKSSLIPTVHIAKAVGWSKGTAPKPAAGLSVTVFAKGLDHPRSLFVLPDGDVLVAETNAPPQPKDWQGITGWVARWVMARAGMVGKSANRIMLLRDSNGDGMADYAHVFLRGLNAPFGMALIGDNFYVADTDALLRFPYRPGETEIAAKGVKVAALPAGPINHHWTKSLVAGPHGRFLYVGVGSNSNAGENGLAVERHRALILKIDAASGQVRVFASGLRNPTGLAWAPGTSTLWAVVNERDGLGSDLVPDYLTHVAAGGFYGWPYSYWGQHIDPRVRPQDPARVAEAIVPDYALGNHVAPLGLAFAKGNLLPPRFRDGAFVSEHGSWNRRPFAGYKVVFVPFANGHPNGKPIDVLTGFLNAEDEAQGRPVGLAFDRAGALLVADDVGNRIWRLAPAKAQAVQ